MSDYVYLAPSPEALETGVPIVLDIETNHDAGHFTWWYRFRAESVGPRINVAFSDGTAAGFEATSWQALAEREGWSSQEPISPSDN